MLCPFFLTAADTPFSGTKLLNINSDQSSFPADLYLKFFKDDKKLSLQEFLEMDNNREIPWKQVPYQGYSFGHVVQPIWFKLTLHNATMPGKIYLAVHYAATDRIELVIPSKKIHRISGLKELNVPREVKSSQHFLSFPMLHGEKLTVYIRVNTRYNFFSGMDILHEDYLYEYLVENNVPFLIFFSIALIIVVQNMFYYRVNRKPVHLYFNGYVIFTVIFQFAILGFGPLLGIKNFVANEVLMHMGCEIAAFFSVFFIIYLMGLDAGFPRLAGFYRKWVWLAFTGMAFYITGYDQFTRIINGIFLISLMFSYYYVAFHHLKRREKGSIIFITSWTMGIFGHFLYVGMNLSFLPLLLDIIHATMSLYIIEIAGISYLIAVNGDLSFIREEVRLPAKNREYSLPEKSNPDEIRKKFDHFMNEEKLFLEWDASVAMFAKKMDVPVYQLSLFFNNHLKRNFRDMLNERRIEFAKRQIEENPEKKIITVLYESGYQSKATFNRLFREITGDTPEEFRKKAMLKRKSG